MKTFNPSKSKIESFWSLKFLSNPIRYWNPEQPPPTTWIRRPTYGSGCSDMISLTLSSAFFVNIIAILLFSYAHRLNPDRPLAGPVELGHDNALPFAKHQIAVCNL